MGIILTYQGGWDWQVMQHAWHIDNKFPSPEILKGRKLLED
jgi:hypothetical protein